MAFCTNCGAQNEENVSFCTNCGAAMDAPETVPAEVTEIEAPDEKKNGMGIASFICGICGLLPCLNICGITPILAIIFASVSKKNVGKNGMATAGLIMGIISVVGCILALIAFALYIVAVFCFAALSSASYY